MPKFTMSDRGFIDLEPITCSYGSKVRVYESSSAESPHIWLNIKVDPEILHGQPEGEGTAHLTLSQARALRDQLHWMIQNHYQGKAARAKEGGK